MQRAGCVVLADGGVEEAELGGLADDEAELAVGEFESVPSSIPNGDDGERFHGRGHAGNGGHGAFDADVVRARHAAANANAPAAARQPVISGAASHGVHQILAEQRLDGGLASCCEPAVQDFEDALRTSCGTQDAAIEQDVRGRRQRCGDRSMLAPRNLAR